MECLPAGESRNGAAIERQESASLRRSCGIAWMLVIQFSRINGHWQIVLPGRQRARGKRGECAGRVVRLIEIENHLPVFWQVGVEKTPGRVSLFSACEILE